VLVHWLVVSGKVRGFGGKVVYSWRALLALGSGLVGHAPKVEVYIASTAVWISRYRLHHDDDGILGFLLLFHYRCLQR
jgi:hypothetical protein